MNEIEAVIDTNIFISALIGRAKSIPKAIINALYERKFSLVISLPLIRELEETLQDPKFKNLFKEKEVEILVTFIKNEARVIQPVQKMNICRDLKDNLVLETAAAAKTKYIVSGDDDLLSIPSKDFSIPIVTPKRFSELLKTE